MVQHFTTYHQQLIATLQKSTATHHEVTATTSKPSKPPDSKKARIAFGTKQHFWQSPRFCTHCAQVLSMTEVVDALFQLIKHRRLETRLCAARTMAHLHLGIGLQDHRNDLCTSVLPMVIRLLSSDKTAIREAAPAVLSDLIGDNEVTLPLSLPGGDGEVNDLGPPPWPGRMHMHVQVRGGGGGGGREGGTLRVGG